MLNSDAMQIEKFYSDIILDCRELQHYFQEMRFTFIRRTERTKNQIVDALAHGCMMGHEPLNVIRRFLVPPNYCQNLLSMDCNRLSALTYY